MYDPQKYGQISLTLKQPWQRNSAPFAAQCKFDLAVSYVSLISM